MKGNEFFSIELLRDGGIEHWIARNTTGNERVPIRAEYILMPMGPNIRKLFLENLQEMDVEDRYLEQMNHLFGILIQNQLYWFVSGYPCTVDGRTFDPEPHWGSKGYITDLGYIETMWKELKQYFQEDWDVKI